MIHGIPFVQFYSKPRRVLTMQQQCLLAIYAVFIGYFLT